MAVIRRGYVNIDFEDENGEKLHTLTINPTDARQYEAIVEMCATMKAKGDVLTAEFEALSKEMDGEQTTDTLDINTVVKATKSKSDFLTEVCTGIDKVFGKGTCSAIFGDAISEFALADFFTALIPYYKEAAEKRRAEFKKGVKSGK